MTAFGPIPAHNDGGCPLCGGSGWITRLDLDGESAWDVPCPEGCPMPELPPLEDTEAPF